jgi:hypothetical protein
VFIVDWHNWNRQKNNTKKFGVDMNINISSRLVIILLLTLTAGTASAQSTNESGAWEIAGLRLGMTPNEVRASLIDRFPFTEGNGTTCAHGGMGVLKNKTREPCGRVGPFKRMNGGRIQFLDANISPTDGSEIYNIRVEFLLKSYLAESKVEQAQAPIFFAHKIEFKHHAVKLDFSPVEFISQKFGEVGEMDRSSSRRIAGAPVWHNYPTEMVAIIRGSTGYEISYSWTGAEEHKVRVKEEYSAYLKRQRESVYQNTSSAKEPF